MKHKIKTNYCLVVALAFAITSITATLAMGIDGNFVGIWMLDEGKGQDVKDLTNNKNDGQLQGGPTWVQGKFGNALEFASGATVIVPNSDSLMPEKDITVTAWVNFSDAGVGQDMVIARIEPGYSLQKFNNDVMEGWVNTAGWQGVRDIAGGEALEPNEWYFVAFTYDGSSLKTYINGKLDRENKISGPNVIEKNPFTIGSYKGENYFWLGMVDEVSVSNIARSEDEINAIMDGFKVFSSVGSEGKLPVTWAQIKHEL